MVAVVVSKEYALDCRRRDVVVFQCVDNLFRLDAGIDEDAFVCAAQVGAVALTAAAETDEVQRRGAVQVDKGRIDFRHTRLWSHVASTAYRRCAKFCIVEQTILVSVVFVFLAHLYLYNKNIAGFLASVG